MAKNLQPSYPMSYPAAVLTDIAVGVAAGLVGVLAMKTFQSVWVNVTETAPKGRPAEEATNAVSNAISGKPVRHVAMKAAIDAVRYGSGAVTGGTYGLVAGLVPLITAGSGALYGALLWLSADTVVIPALGLAPAPTKTSPQEHGYSLASYLVFGVALDLTRRTLNRWISFSR
jgi:putative membrane protein